MNPIKIRSLLTLHRRMGLISALFVIVLCVSGFLIHHSSSLGLDQRFANSQLLLNWYGLEAPLSSVQYAANGHSLSLLADAVYFDDRRLPGVFNNLRGMVAGDFGFVAALRDQLILISSEGELIEILTSVNGVPQAIEAIGISQSGGVVLRVNNAENLLGIDLDSLASTPLQHTTGIQWSVAQGINESLARQNQANYANTLLNLDRVILDIHSGRFFGSFGVLLVDLMALLFVLMALSGVWIWTRRRSQ
jgi:hypothetical protein